MIKTNLVLGQIQTSTATYRQFPSLTTELLGVNRSNSTMSLHWGVVRLDLCSQEKPQHNPHGHISYSIRIQYQPSTPSSFIKCGHCFLQPIRFPCFQRQQEMMQLTSRWAGLSLRVSGRMESTRQCEKNINQHHKGYCLCVCYVLHPVMQC